MNNSIQSTTDYDQFKVVNANRKVIDNHVANLTRNILSNNLLSVNPIIVNDKFEVIDGQHRLEVARNNNLEIFYVVSEGSSIKDVIELNSVNRTWKVGDYLDSYVSRGYENYIWLKDTTEKYKVSVSDCLMFISGKRDGWYMERFRKGEFSIEDTVKNLTTDRLDFYWDVRPYLRYKGLIPRQFLLGLIDLHSKGLSKKLLQGLRKRGNQIMPESQDERVNAQFEEIMSR